ncbi:MAG TPA: ATP-dependent helicase [Actinopolymorphaceae bacterium]
MTAPPHRPPPGGSGFSPATQAWFDTSFAEATAAQAGAWDAIRAGSHTLVVAPTGSGKTLAAFLWAIDQLVADPSSWPDGPRTQVLYVSPLKALAVDVERNLRSPLAGIAQAARRLGLPEPSVSIGTRTGDTPAAERRLLIRRPPDILITTPESLYLLLTSAARSTLTNVRTVIVDEIHAVAATKRGAHLAVSLERLDALLAEPAQRIGLSATVAPVESVARFLGGATPVSVVMPPSAKQVELTVVVPVPDLADLDAMNTPPGTPRGPAPAPVVHDVLDDDDLERLGNSPAGDRVRASIWPHVEERIVDLVLEHESTIVFVNSRRIAERLTARLNEIATARESGEELPEHDPPAQVMAQSGSTSGAAHVIARAHHGSVSKEQRAMIEDDLKSGRLRCVVATSSLELGIDMGAVDLVVQVEAPPSVASGLQRVGRAGHHVGAVSRGVMFPKFRGDLVASAITAERMKSGQIESLSVPTNPLDVLAQHIVAAVSLDDWAVDDMYDLVRRTASFATLPRSAYEAVLDMLAGRYPSDEFAQLRPRLVWDRVAGTLTARPGAQRLAVTSGGTIPDRGLFGVHLVGGDEARGGNRVGELDEEMVYESRVGDVFSLGATSWRIEDITHDRVLVSPAPGQAGRLPFWKGDAPGRPAELGAALGAFVRDIERDEVAGRVRLEEAGLDTWAADNLLAFLREQREATGRVPDDRTLVVERFRDELGDWRVCLHSPYGSAVHAPWALAVAARVQERYGVDAQAASADDGIVVRIPDTDAEPPGADIFVLDPDVIDDVVTEQVGGSALFAARFRECAARALLLPRRDPGKRTPLWQQRMRSAQLLEVASRYGSFPIVLETLREVLQDVYDVPGLVEILRRIETRRIRLVEVETPHPSPYAGALAFGYVAGFLYEGDAPLAERRAAALSLDPTLLADLLGRTQLRDLLDAGVVARVEADLQRLSPDRAARDAEGVADLLRQLGPLPLPQITRRVVDPSRAQEWLEELLRARRAVVVRVAGRECYASVEDAARLRDALGVALPVGLPAALLEPVADPLSDLVSRFARTHAPFVGADVAAEFGLGVAVVGQALSRLAQAHRVEQGEFTPGRSGTEWCDSGVLRTLRSRSLAALRREVEPVKASTLGRFLPAWQHIREPLRGVDGLMRVVEQLAGAPVPASALESLVLPARVRDYHPAMLDELTSAGEVVWAGNGSLPGAAGGWVSLHPADSAHLTLPWPTPEPVEAGVVDRAAGGGSARGAMNRVVDALGSSGAFFFRQLADAVGRAAVIDADQSDGGAGVQLDDAALEVLLWEAVWAGFVTNDTLAPLRATLGASHRRAPAARLRRSPRGRLVGAGAGRPRMPSRSGPPTVAGRWSLLPEREPDATKRAHALAEALLDRHGVVTRGAVMSEHVVGGFSAVYRVLSVFEEAGRARRGYYVAGLGAAQFGATGAVDRLRAEDTISDDPYRRAPARGNDPAAIVLAACDPANPYGAALAWPPGQADAPKGHRPGRKAGAVVVLVDGDLVLYVEAGGKTLLSFGDDRSQLERAAEALAGAVKLGALGKLAVERADGATVHGSPLAEALQSAGFTVTPRGLRLRG